MSPGTGWGSVPGDHSQQSTLGKRGRPHPFPLGLRLGRERKLTRSPTGLECWVPQGCVQAKQDPLQLAGKDGGGGRRLAFPTGQATSFSWEPQGGERSSDHRVHLFRTHAGTVGAQTCPGSSSTSGAELGAMTVKGNAEGCPGC